MLAHFPQTRGSPRRFPLASCTAPTRLPGGRSCPNGQERNDMRLKWLVALYLFLMFGAGLFAQQVTLNGGYNGPDSGVSNGGVIGYGNPNAVTSSFPLDVHTHEPAVVNYTFTAETTLETFEATSGHESSEGEVSVTFDLFDNGNQFASCTWSRSSAGSATSCTANFSQVFNPGDNLSLELVGNANSNGSFVFISGASWTFTGAPPTPAQQFWILEDDSPDDLAPPQTVCITGETDNDCNEPQPLIVVFDTLNGAQVHLGGTSGGAD